MMTDDGIRMAQHQHHHHNPYRNQVMRGGQFPSQEMNQNPYHQDRLYQQGPVNSYWPSNQGGYNGSHPQQYLPQEFQRGHPYPQTQLVDPPKQVLETKYVLMRNGPLGSSGQASAAANFFAKSGQYSKTDDVHSHSKASTTRNRYPEENNSSEERERFPTNFRALVHRSPPPIPSHLLRRLEEVSPSGGKIKVFLRVTRSNHFDFEDENNKFFLLDRRRRQVTLYDPCKGASEVTAEERGVGIAAPKMYAFDGVFSSDDPQEEVCSAALSDVISSVVASGTDGCLFCYGHANTGKSQTMLGGDGRSIDMGAIPTAVAWLYRAVKERKSKTGARFSVRVSAMEITGRSEEPRDLLANYSSPEDNDRSPAFYLRGGSTDWIHNQTELRASSAEKAAYYLDAALSERSHEARGRESHLLFTIHVYQYSVDGKKGGLTGGRSRMHLIDFGGCERTRLPGGGITLSGLGNVILGIFSGQKHLPHRESNVTKILKDCLSSSSCQAAMIAHVSPEPAHYSETLHTVHLSARLHRMKRKMPKRGSSSGSRSRKPGSSGSGQSSSDFTGTGTSTNASSSEFSCDTVVYRGGHSDGSGTDCEHPPSLLIQRGGSLDNIPGRRPRSTKILTNGAISPRNCLSPIQRARPASSLSGGLAAIPEVVHGGKMPLSGLVPIQSSQRMRQTAGNGFSNYPHHSVPHKVETKLEQPHLSEVYHLPQDQLNQMQQQQQQQQQNYFKARKTYGYMDEHKVNMIHTWVENTSGPKSDEISNAEAPVFRVLTQFKTADSDESSSEHKVVEVHQSEETLTENQLNKVDEVSAPKKRQPPPPPPRRTPPRDTKDINESDYNQVVDVQDQIKFETKVTEMIDLQCEMVETTDTSCQVNEDEITKSTQYFPFNDESDDLENERHPLRILSEENLTCVSSFAGSNQKLDFDSGENHDEVDPSRLSFFGLPDFSLLDHNEIWQSNGQDIIGKKFQLLAQMEKRSEGFTEEIPQSIDLNHGNKEVLLTFPRNQVLEKPEQSTEVAQVETPVVPTFSYREMSYNDGTNEELTPQKNFYLLSQSLRHPDGSSNPEINRILEKPQRSPGNGRSGSEDDLNSNTYEKDHLNNINDSDTTEDLPKQPGQSNKFSKRFGLRFLSIFSSTITKNNSNKNEDVKRSKSCDRKLEESQQNSEKTNHKKHRSSSSSPSLKASNKLSIFKNNSGSKNQEHYRKADPSPLPNPEGIAPMIETPSTMSLATEWEFCNNEPQQQQQHKVKKSPGNIQTNFENIIIKNGGKMNRVPPASMAKRGDRKSSGYDSLGGDESSSLDSSQESQSPQLPKQPPMTRISENDSESIGENVYVNQNHNLINNNLNNNHVSQNNGSSGNNNNGNNSFDSEFGLVQYEEVDILRMDQQRGWRLFHQQFQKQDKKTFSSFS